MAKGTFLAPLLLAPTLVHSHFQNEPPIIERPANASAFTNRSGAQQWHTNRLNTTLKVNRQTYEYEQAIAKIRSWKDFADNWDGEGAVSPKAVSIEDSISFAMLLNQSRHQIEPSLLASGNISLVWNYGAIYGEIEFMGNNKLAYYIENEVGKHKGVMSFDSKKMPQLFTTLLNI